MNGKEELEQKYGTRVGEYKQVSVKVRCWGVAGASSGLLITN